MLQFIDIYCSVVLDFILAQACSELLAIKKYFQRNCINVELIPSSRHGWQIQAIISSLVRFLIDFLRICSPWEYTVV